MPGNAEQKRPLIECMSCHTFERIVRSKYKAQEFFGVLNRMANYANNTTMARIQPRVAERKPNEELARKLADYLATVNLSKSATWQYELKTLPRPSGRATRVVITEYDLPRKSIAPHDVRTDAQGNVWYSNFVENTLGRLDPATGAHAEFRFPAIKPGAPEGSRAPVFVLWAGSVTCWTRESTGFTNLEAPCRVLCSSYFSTPLPHLRNPHLRNP